MQRILKRQFYKNIASINVDANHVLKGRKPKELEAELRDLAKNMHDNLALVTLQPDDLIVLQSKVGTKSYFIGERRPSNPLDHFQVSMGMGNRNPLHNVSFYTKNNQIVETVSSLGITSSLPSNLNFETVFIVCKSLDERALKEAVRVKNAWIAKQGIPNLQDEF